MPYVFGGLGLFCIALTVHGIVTGTLEVKGGIQRAMFPKTFWFCCACFGAVGLNMLWTAWYAFAYLS